MWIPVPINWEGEEGKRPRKKERKIENALQNHYHMNIYVGKKELLVGTTSK